MCRSVVDIQSPTAEIRREKKEERRRRRRRKEQDENVYGLPYYIGRPSRWALAHILVEFSFFSHVLRQEIGWHEGLRNDLFLSIGT